MGPTPGNRPHLPLRAAQLRQAPGTLPLDQGLKPLPDQRRPFFQPANALRFGEKLVIDVQRGSHRSYLNKNEMPSSGII